MEQFFEMTIRYSESEDSAQETVRVAYDREHEDRPVRVSTLGGADITHHLTPCERKQVLDELGTRAIVGQL